MPEANTDLEPLDQIGQRARGAIVAAKKHDMQSTNLWLTAGTSLLAAKKRVLHGQWYRWLLDQKIHPSSADKAMAIAKADDPHAATEKVRAAGRAATAKWRQQGSNPHHSDMDSATAPVTTAGQTEAMRRIKRLNPEQLRAVLAFIDTLQTKPQGRLLLAMPEAVADNIKEQPKACAGEINEAYRGLNAALHRARTRPNERHKWVVTAKGHIRKIMELMGVAEQLGVALDEFMQVIGPRVG